MTTKDANSTRTTDEGSSNAFQAGMPGTAARDRAEGRIEGVRDLGGVFVEAVRATRLPMVLTDPTLPGDPIVFANQAFLDLSGYAMDEVLGQQPHFMNGPGTDPEDSARFTEILANDEDGVVETIQYAKDGRRFVATVLLSAFKDEDGQTCHHFLTWSDVTRRVDAEDEAADLRITQATLRESEAKFRTLFESIDEGFCLIEYVDDLHRSSDYRFLEVNAAFEKLTGVTGAVGKLLSEVSPDSENYWRETYAEVARTGVARRVENYHEETGRWYDVFVSRVGGQGSRRICLVFTDTTDRKRAEAVLRESEERQAFLLKLSDAMRPDMKADAVGALAMRMVAEHLGVDRCYIARFSREEKKGWVGPEFRSPGLPALTGEYPFAAFPEIITRMETGPLVIRDGFTDPSLSETDRQSYRTIGLRAVLTAPLRRGERNAVWSLTAAATQPRDWTDGELKLLEDVAERTWAAIERARAEAALRESEVKYASLFAASPAPFLILRPDAPAFTIADVNDAYLAATMRTRENLVGRAMFEAFPDNPDDPTATGVSALRASLERALASRRFELMDVQRYDVVRPDGTFEERWWKPANAPVVDANRNVVAIIHHVADVTAEHRAAAALRESEERLSLAIAVGEFASWDWDLRTDAVTWNDRHYLVQGYEVGEVTPSFEAWLARVHSDDREWTVAEIEAARDGKTSYAHQFRTQWPDGTVRWCSARGRFFYDGAGEPYRMIGVMEDVTGERLGGDALRESEERLRLIIENAEDYAIFTTDPTGTIVDWRDGAEAVFGFTGEEIVGQSCDILFTPEDREKGEPEKERATAVTEGRAADVRWHLRKGGERVFIDGVSTALRGADGALIGFLKIGQDVTERHEAGRRQSLLLAELQHRVRNTLAMIRSLVRQSSDKYEDQEEFTAHLVGRLDAMARTQVLLTRAPGAKVDLQALVWDELESQLADEKRVKVAGPDVNLSPKAAEVLTLALHELATNSLKYGALSDADGRLSVTWGISPIGGADWLQLTWEERVRDAQLRPRTAGFGTELIEERVPYELQGEANLHITSGGARAEIAFPLTDGSSILETGPAGGTEP